MPCHDGSGPQGTGKPGRGLGPCHTEQKDAKGKLHNHKHGHHHGCRCGCHQSESQKEPIYDYTTEELQNKKQTLEKELQWLNERINEIGDSNENSNSSN